MSMREFGRGPDTRDQWIGTRDVFYSGANVVDQTPIDFICPERGMYRVRLQAGGGGGATATVGENGSGGAGGAYGELRLALARDHVLRIVLSPVALGATLGGVVGNDAAQCMITDLASRLLLVCHGGSGGEHLAGDGRVAAAYPGAVDTAYPQFVIAAEDGGYPQVNSNLPAGMQASGGISASARTGLAAFPIPTTAVESAVGSPQPAITLYGQGGRGKMVGDGGSRYDGGACYCHITWIPIPESYPTDF